LKFNISKHTWWLHFIYIARYICSLIYHVWTLSYIIYRMWWFFPNPNHVSYIGEFRTQFGSKCIKYFLFLVCAFHMSMNSTWSLVYFSPILKFLQKLTSIPCGYGHTTCLLCKNQLKKLWLRSLNTKKIDGGEGTCNQRKMFVKKTIPKGSSNDHAFHFINYTTLNFMHQRFLKQRLIFLNWAYWKCHIWRKVKLSLHDVHHCSCLDLSLEIWI
jgi:hypothetical protein